MVYKQTGKSVLLFSGGMDSIIHAELLNPDMILRISLGETYEKMERQQALKVVFEMAWEKKFKEIRNVFNFTEMELDNLIIPNRNAYLILKASEYGDKIYLSAIEGDTNKDKDEPFFPLMQNLLNHLWEEHGWTETRKFEVLAPFQKMTKTELLAAFLARQRATGHTEKEAILPILTSYSCFTGDEKPCGICKPCMRKAVALVNNGFNIYENEGYFVNDPLEGLEKLKDKFPGNYRGREGYDTLMAYAKMKELPRN
jgi:7-cyano-7-deazaguanine synthase in queuosine biosynthesis